MAERYKQLKEMMQTKDMFHQLTISDYLFNKCLLFAKVNLPEEEFKLYQKLFDIIYPQIIQPEILIYLHSPIHKLQDNIRKRNREYEQQIPDDYLLTLQETYTRYIKQQDIKTLFIDTSNADFTNNPKHLAAVIEALDKDYAPGQHYLNLPA
jgi:deoxyadenosine/deoxycytidine kinase